jgi:hypothetical protein
MSTIICSHGFGVRADSMGMFTDIAAAFPEHTFIIFDYNEIDDAGNLTLRPLKSQAALLQQHVDAHPGAIVLAHSQGCIVAGLIDPTNTSRVILLAPPLEIKPQQVVDTFKKIPGAIINRDGVSTLPRRDGTTTFLPKEFIDDVSNVQPYMLYAAIASKRPTTIIRATNDEMLGLTDVDHMRVARIIDIEADHNFRNDARQLLIKTLSDLLS